MEENNNKNMWIWAAVVVVVLAVCYWVWLMNRAPEAPGYTSTNTTTDNSLGANLGNNPPASTEDTSTGSVNVGAPAASISYQNALVKYKDARLQLDKVCQASPDKMTFKNNAYLMVDNRAPVDRVVKVGSVFNIKAYGFKIIKLGSATLPVTWLVDCDKSQNVSSILIEK